MMTGSPAGTQAQQSINTAQDNILPEVIRLLNLLVLSKLQSDDMLSDPTVRKILAPGQAMNMIDQPLSAWPQPSDQDWRHIKITVSTAAGRFLTLVQRRGAPTTDRIRDRSLLKQLTKLLAIMVAG